MMEAGITGVLNV